MLRLSRSDYDGLRKHAEEAYPQECCGVLIGKLEGGDRVVRAHIRCRNAHAETPSHRYNIAPEELIAAQKTARQQGLDIVGFYHSHPDHPARWSQHDLEEAHWFACSYVIVGVQSGKAAESNSFVLCGNDEESKRFDSESIEILDLVKG